VSEIRECHRCEAERRHAVEPVTHDGVSYTLYTCFVCETMTRRSPERLGLVEAIEEYLRDAAMPGHVLPPAA
jgi:hypothetical protein